MKKKEQQRAAAEAMKREMAEKKMKEAAAKKKEAEERLKEAAAAEAFRCVQDSTALFDPALRPYREGVQMAGKPSSIFATFVSNPNLNLNLVRTSTILHVPMLQADVGQRELQGGHQVG